MFERLVEKETEVPAIVTCTEPDIHLDPEHEIVFMDAKEMRRTFHDAGLVHFSQHQRCFLPPAKDCKRPVTVKVIGEVGGEGGGIVDICVNPSTQDYIESHDKRINLGARGSAINLAPDGGHNWFIISRI